MKAIELRHAYAETLRKRGHFQLPDHPLVNPNGDGPYFNGSALTPNLGYFLGTKERPSNELFTQQRVFWTRFADLANQPDTPVWTIFQVMMSFYLFDQPNLQNAFDIGLELLTEMLGIPRHNLLLVMPDNAGLAQMVQRSGMIADNIVLRPPTNGFKVDDLLTGFYCKFLVRYRNGMLPILDIINIEGPNGTVMVDSCMLLERVSFIEQGMQTWYETDLFLPLMRAIEEAEGTGVFDNTFVYKYASMVRSIVAVLADGADISPKGKGYVVKKIMRQMLQEKVRLGYKGPLEALVRPSLRCIEEIGYHWGEKADEIEAILHQEEQSFGKWHAEATRFLQKQVQLRENGKRGHFTGADLHTWKDSRGVPYEMAEDFLIGRGYVIEEYEREKPPETVFITDAYPYDASKRIEDPKRWLQELGKK